MLCTLITDKSRH